MFAFSNCGIETLEIPASVTKIDSNPFFNCPDMRSITVAGDNPEFEIVETFLVRKDVYPIEAIAVVNLNDGHAVLPYGTRVLEHAALSSMLNIRTIDLPDTLEEIEDTGLSLQRELLRVELPDSVTMLGERVFENCYSLTEVVFPKSITTIDPETFSGCKNVTLIVSPGSRAEKFAMENHIPYHYAE